MSVTEFKNYIQQRPSAIKKDKQLLALLKDVMGNDEKHYRVLKQAHEAGILDLLRTSNPPPTIEQQRMISSLVQQYSMPIEAARYALDFWIKSFDGFSFDAIGDDLRSAMSLPKDAVDVDHNSAPELFSISYNPMLREVMIQWKRQSNVAGYEIWRSVNTERAELIKSGTFPLPRFADKDILSGDTVAYAIRALSRSNESPFAFSNVLQIAVPSTEVPFEINQVRSMDGSVQLQWSYQVDTEQYIIRRKYSESDDWQIIATIPNTQFTFTDYDVAIDTQQLYQIECQRRNHVALLSHEVAIII